MLEQDLGPVTLMVLLHMWESALAAKILTLVMCKTARRNVGLFAMARGHLSNQAGLFLKNTLKVLPLPGWLSTSV